MRRLNPAYLQAVSKKVNRSPYFGLISMKIMDLKWGRSRIEVVVGEKHLQPFGKVHGGVYSSLVDAAAFWAVYPQVDESFGITTVELKLNYLAPASEGFLIGKGKSIKVGKSLCLAEASVEDGTGRLLAYGTETMMVRRDLEMKAQAKLPPKFLE